MPAMLGPTDTTLARLMSVINRGVIVLDDDQVAQSISSARLESYRNVAMHLRICFSVDTNSPMNGFCIPFPSLASTDFILGVKNSEPVALFILIHWVVLLQRLGD